MPKLTYMCGIFALFNNTEFNDDIIKMYFLEGKNRGPESTKFEYLKTYNLYLGFHRLAINGFNDVKSEQPFKLNNKILICNGEIYNHKELFKIMNVTPYSKSDCEVILHCYEKYGIEYTLKILDGVYAFILLDFDTGFIFVSRDMFGIRPLFMNKFYSTRIDESKFAFASELKSIEGFDKYSNNVKQVNPGSLITLKITKDFIVKKGKSNYTVDFINEKQVNFIHHFCNFNYNLNKSEILKRIYKTLENAVIKRVKNTDREIACLLSGGLDSSLIAALVKKHYKGELHTWSIGMEGSEDLRYAQIVADHIGSTHHSIVVSEKEFLNYIPEVIKDIESYDTTTVRASVGNWLISKYIKENSDAKVIFNGDGSDEVMGGYIYMHMAPNSLDFDKETIRLLNNIHYFDVLRSDRCISSHGLEARTPFLDRQFVANYLSIHPNIRNHSQNNQCEKFLIRKAVEVYDYDLLPKNVLWRMKEAFSDGVSKQTKSWYEIIQDYVKNEIYSHLNDESEKKIIKEMNPYRFNKPETLEQLYYRDIFSKYYQSESCQKIIPYFWMPNFVDAKDASARSLEIYNKKISTEI